MMSSKRQADAVDDVDIKEGRSSKKRRTYTEEDAKLAKIYDDLASEDEKARVTAAIDLVRKCADLVKPEADDSDSQLHKIHIRLIRGLCSNRKGARIGFSLALTEVLPVTFSRGFGGDGVFDVKLNALLKLVKEQTKTEGGASTQEKRNYLIGRVFTYHCIVRSKLLAEKYEVGLPLIIRQLCELGSSVSWTWLKEECGLVAYEAVRLLCQNGDSHAQAETAYQVLVTMDGAKALKTPEGVAIWLEIATHINTRFPAGIWHKNNPLSGKDIGTLAKILHSVKLEDDEPNGASGTRQMRPHFAWAVVLQHSINMTFVQSKAKAEMPQNDNFKLKHAAPFGQLWTEAVDNMFFAPAASPEKKAIGFQVFQQIMLTAPVAALEATFSPKLMKCLINQSASSQRYLHVAAKQLLEAVVARAMNDEKAASVIFTALISGNGSLSFDKLTKTNTMATIASKASVPTQLEILDVYSRLLQRPGVEKPAAADGVRNTIADHLVSMTRLPSASATPSMKWMRKLFAILVAAGYTRAEDGKDFVPTMTSKCQESMRNRLQSCMANLLAGVATSHQAVEVLNILLDLLQGIDCATLADADVEVKKLIQQASSTITSSALPDAQSSAVSLIASMTRLQAYNGEADAVNMLTELNDLFSSTGSTKKSSTTLSEEVISSLTEILLSFCSQTTALHRRVAELAFTDLAPVLTPQALHSMLDVLEQKEGLAGQQALFGDNTAMGEEVEEEESEDEDMDDASDDQQDADTSSDEESEDEDTTQDYEIVDVDDEDSDVEIVNGELVTHDSDADSSESSDDSDDTSSSASDPDQDDQAPDELTEFEKKLASILNVPGSSSTLKHDNTNMNDDDSQAASTSSDSSMDSTQMAALDDHLSAIFKSRAQSGSTTKHGHGDSSLTKAQTQRHAKENIINFKNRVLDLLTIWLKQGGYKHEMSLAIILPLLRCIRETRTTQVRERASRVLLEGYVAVAKKKGLPKVDVDGQDAESTGDDGGDDDTDDSADSDAPADLNAWTLLKRTQHETLLFPSREHAKAGSRACLFLARCLLGSASAASDASAADVRKRIAALYASSRESAMKGIVPAEGKEKTKKKDKKDKKKGIKEGIVEETKLPDWQEAVWREWEEFDRQTSEVARRGK